MTRIGISACLLGEAVRHDGGHKRAASLLEDAVLGIEAAQVSWVPVCPEVELGMGVPRPPIRLETDGTDTSLVAVDGRGPDHAPAMGALAAARAASLSTGGLDGFVFKSRSPSCGVGDAPLHDADGRVVGHRDGVFADALRRALPDLPVATEAELDTAEARARFLARCRAYRQSRSKGE